MTPQEQLELRLRDLDRAERRRELAIHALFRALAGKTVTYASPTPEDAKAFAQDILAAARLLNRKDPA